MNKTKLTDKISKYYWAHGQTLIVDTWEMMEENDRDCMFDVILEDSNICLFTIQNYNGFNDAGVGLINHFKNPTCKLFYVWDGVKASCAPLYFDNIITLKTFKPITKEDIVNATRYYIREILGIYLIFNIKFSDKERK